MYKKEEMLAKSVEELKEQLAWEESEASKCRIGIQRSTARNDQGGVAFWTESVMFHENGAKLCREYLARLTEK